VVGKKRAHNKTRVREKKMNKPGGGWEGGTDYRGKKKTKNTATEAQRDGVLNRKTGTPF